MSLLRSEVIPAITKLETQMENEIASIDHQMHQVRTEMVRIHEKTNRVQELVRLVPSHMSMHCFLLP
jgi:archaellum component FlaC